MASLEKERERMQCVYCMNELPHRPTTRAYLLRQLCRRHVSPQNEHKAQTVVIGFRTRISAQWVIQTVSNETWQCMVDSL